MAVRQKYRLGQFSQVFNLRNKQGTPYLLKFTATKRARKIGSELGIDCNDTLPWAAIAGSEDEKLRRFLENQRPD